MEYRVQFSTSTGRPTFIPHGEWTPAMASAFEASGFPALQLTVGNLFPFTTLDFLPELTNLKEIFLNPPVDADLAPVGEMAQVQYLSLTKNNQLKIPALEKCLSLKYLSIAYIPSVMESIEQLALEELFLYGYNLEEMKQCPLPKPLKALELRAPTIFKQFDDDNQLNQLEKLTINGAPKIFSVESLGKLATLRELSILNTSATLHFDWLEKASHLEKLYIFGCRNLRNITGLQKAQKLKSLILIDATVQDGKLSFLKQMPNLTNAEIMQNTRYDIDTEELPFAELSPEEKWFRRLVTKNIELLKHKFSLDDPPPTVQQMLEIIGEEHCYGRCGYSPVCS